MALAFLLLPMCQYISKPCTSGNKYLNYFFAVKGSNRKGCTDLLTDSFSYLSHRISFGLCGRFTGAELLSFSLALTIVCVWILTGHWLLMDGNNCPHGLLRTPFQAFLITTVIYSYFYYTQPWVWDCVLRSSLSSVCPVSRFQPSC